MTSPYSSNLLLDATDEEFTSRPRASRREAAGHVTRSVTHVVAQPQQAMMPMPQQPMYIMQAPGAPARIGAGAAVSSLLLALIVICLGAVALIGGYYATKQASPSAAEAASATNIATRTGYQYGMRNGIASGRQNTLETTSTSAALRASIARDAAYQKAYTRGLRAGERSYRRPTVARGSGYRGTGISYPRVSELSAAVGYAQNLANISGASVVVEQY